MPGQVESRQIEVQRHGIMYLVSTMGITLTGFLATMFYAHWLGAAILGAYFLFLSYYNLLTLFSDVGLNAAGLKRISEGTEQDSYFTAGLTLRMSLFLIASVWLVLFRDRFVDLNAAGLFWFLIAAFGIGTLESCLSSGIGAANRLGLAASMSLLNNLSRIGLQILFVFAGFQLFGLATGLIAGLLIEIPIALRYIDFRLRPFSQRHVQSLFSYSSWAFLYYSGVAVFDNIGIVLLGYFFSATEVGVFGVCYSFSFFALFASTALCNTLWVKVSRWSTDGDLPDIAVALSRACSYALLLAVPIFVGGTILGDRLLYHLYSASFTPGTTALILLLLARAVQSVYQLFCTFLLALDQARSAFFVVLAGNLLYLGLALALIPLAGITGAAIGSLGAVLVGVLLAYRGISRFIPVALDVPFILRITGAAGIMGAAVLLLRQILGGQTYVTPVLLVLLGAGIYFGIVLLVDPGLRDDVKRTFLIRWTG